MGKAEAGSLKAISNAMKARGLTKLRFYCQICQKACRDENGYKNHIESEAHMRQMDVLTSSGNTKKAIDDFSATFQKEFVQLLSRRFGTRRIKANQVYQEYIADRHHLHMNATKWMSLSEFVKHLGREGIAQVEDTDQGWYLTWIDNSPAALARQDALQKLERAKMDDEQRQRKLLQEQIERAKAAGPSDGASTPVNESKAEEGLKRDGFTPVRIGITLAARNQKQPNESKSDSSSGTSGATSSATGPLLKPASSSTATNGSTPSSSAPAFKMGFNALKSSPRPVNPLKSSDSISTRSNPLKSDGRTESSTKKTKPPANLTMAEKIMMEETERKKRKAESGSTSAGASRGPGPGPHMQQGIKRSRF